MISTEDAVAEVLATPYSTVSLTLVNLEAVELIVTFLELLEGVVPLGVLANCSSDAELLVIMGVDTECAASRVRDPCWVDVSVADIEVIVLVILLEEKRLVDMVCVQGF